MTNIFTLVGSVFVDNKQANKSLHKTDTVGQKVGKTFQKGIKTVGKWGLAAGGAAVAAGGAMFAAAEKIAETTDNIDKMSQKLGLSREAYQEWDFILSQSGASIDSMKGGLKTLTNSIDDAKKGIGPGAEAFERLNISMEQLDGKSQEEAFELVVQSLQGVTDETERAALANDLLGRSGQELAPLLNAGAEATEEMRQKAHELGLVLGDEAIDAGVLFTDTWDQLKRSLKAVGLQIGGVLLPIFNKAMNFVIDHMPQIQAVFSAVFGVVKDVVFGAYEAFQIYLLPILTTAFNWVKDHMPQIQENAGSAFEKIKERVVELVTEIKDFFLPILDRLWVVFRDNILPILQDLFAWVQDHMPQIKTIFETVWDAVKVAIDVVVTIIETFFDVLSNVYEYVKGPFSFLGELVISAFGGAVDFISGFIDTIKSVVDWLSRAIDKINIFNRTDVKQKQANFGVGFNSASAVTGRSPSATSATSYYSPYGGVNVNISGNNIMSDDDPVIDAIGNAVVDNLRLAGVS